VLINTKKWNLSGYVKKWLSVGQEAWRNGKMVKWPIARGSEEHEK
jgi:hypothetical protein